MCSVPARFCIEWILLNSQTAVGSWAVAVSFHEIMGQFSRRQLCSFRRIWGGRRQCLQTCPSTLSSGSNTIGHQCNFTCHQGKVGHLTFPFTLRRIPDGNKTQQSGFAKVSTGTTRGQLGMMAQYTESP